MDEWLKVTPGTEITGQFIVIPWSVVTELHLMWHWEVYSALVWADDQITRWAPLDEVLRWLDGDEVWTKEEIKNGEAKAKEIIETLGWDKEGVDDE